MGSLIDCLTKLGISGPQADYIKNTAARYKKEGFEPQEAHERTVRELITHNRRQYKTALQQVSEQVPQEKWGDLFTERRKKPKTEQSPAEAAAPEAAQNVTTNEPQPSTATTTQEPFVPTGNESAFVPKSVLQFNAVSDQASRGVESLKRTFKKNFLSGGEQNEATRKLLFERNGTINGHLAELAQNGKALERAVRAEYNLPRTKQIPDAIAQTLDEALKDPTKMQALPTDVAVVLQKLRDHVDGLSQTVKGLPGISPDLTVTIDQNMGQYITRTYKKFGDTEGWIRKALGDPQIMQDFTAEVRQTSPNASDEEIKNLAEILLRRDTLNLSDLGRFSPRTQKYVDVLKERKNLSDAVRNLYGERKNAFENYTETVAKLSNLIANRQFVDNLKNIGLQQGFFSDRSQPQIGHTAEVNWKQLPQLRSLEGVLMDPVTANSVNDIYTVHVPSKLERLWLKPMIASKAMKTVGSVRATLRNFTGNLPIAVANGAWDVRKMSAIRDTIHDLTKTGDAAMQAKLRRYHELGLIEGVNQESLRDMASRVSASMEDYISGIDSRDHFKNFTRGVASVYQSMDTVWKLHTFENEMQAYREAYPKMPQAELETMVARNVRNLTPTYSEASKAARWWSRNMPLGPFAMFNFEIMRTSAARARIMAQEFSSGNPVLQRHALKRAVGQALVLGVGYGVEKAAEWTLGMSDDEKEAMRSRVAPWQKNSPLIVTDYDKDKGTISYYDAGYNDPFSIFTNSIIALYRGHPLEAIQQASEPFLAEDLAWGAIVSALRNKDADGRPIYDEGLSPSQQWKQIGKYVAGRFVPGTFTDFDRIIKASTGVTSKSGKQYDLGNEITSLAAGARKETLDRAQADFYRNREYNERVQASEKSIRATFLAKGSFDAEKATELYHSAEDSRKKGLDQWRKFVDGSVLLGEKNPYQKVVSDVGAASKIVKLMYARQYRPYQFRSQDLAKMRRLPDGEARVALYLKLARERTSGSASTATSAAGTQSD